MVPRNRTKGNEHKLEHRNFHLNLQKNFIPLRVRDHWHRLPSEAVGSPYVETFQTCLDTILCDLL